MRLVIIDYNLSNLFSVEHAFESLGASPEVTADKEIITQADAISLPGVGAFGEAMDNLNNLGLVDVIKGKVAEGIPFLGVCLGMQLLFEQSEEFGNYKGLGLIEGVIKKFPKLTTEYPKVKVPQIAWNRINTGKNSWDNTPLASLEDGEFMYFVHSYYAAPKNEQDIITLTNYCGLEYCSAIRKENIFATQFHPEKSGEKGLSIYKNWLEQI